MQGTQGAGDTARAPRLHHYRTRPCVPAELPFLRFRLLVTQPSAHYPTGSAECDLGTSSISRGVLPHTHIGVEDAQQPRAKPLKCWFPSPAYPRNDKPLWSYTAARGRPRRGPWPLTWALSTCPLTMSRKTLGPADAMAGGARKATRLRARLLRRRGCPGNSRRSALDKFPGSRTSEAASVGG